MVDAIWTFLSDQGYQPHGFCLLWNPAVFWTHVVADVAIAASYFSIPIAIFYLALRRRDIRYGWLLSLFGVFIVGCGVTHLFGVWTMWVPSYGAEAVAKAATAAVSAATAVALWPLMPTLVSLPTTAQLEETNAALRREIADREAAEAKLKALNDELEQRVFERTRVLEETNAALAEAKREAEESNRLKSEFLATMSHEIRTPMNGVIGMLEMLRLSGLDARQTDYAATAVDSAMALLQVLNDVLDYSRMEAGGLTIDAAPYRPGALASDVARLFAPQAAAKGLRLDLTAPDGEDAPVIGDAARVRQVLTNLVSNAVKFTETGFVALALSRERAADGGPLLRFTVSDSGIGVPKAAQARLFKRFSQADGAITRRYGGSGLGLAICRQLVTLMGGEIGVESEEGRGSRFWFTLPAPAAADADTGPGDPAAPVGPGGRVLLVDDHAVNRRVASAFLTSAGYAVDVAEDGQTAVAAADATPYDAIVMDISMPGMDGIEAMRRIRAGGGRSATAPILALTAHAMAGDRERFLAAGMTDYVSKPFAPNRLLDAVASTVRSRREAAPPPAAQRARS